MQMSSTGWGRKKVKQFRAPSSKIACIPLKKAEGVRGGEEAGGVEGQQGVVMRGQRSKKIQNGQKGDKRFEEESRAGVQH